MKGLPKSLRTSSRYLVFTIESRPDERVAEHELQREIWFEAQNLYGDIVSSKAGLELVEYTASSEEKPGYGVLRCRYDTVEEARVALACVDQVDGTEVGVVVTGVSGTIDSARSKHLEPQEVGRFSYRGRNVDGYMWGERVDLAYLSGDGLSDDRGSLHQDGMADDGCGFDGGDGSDAGGFYGFGDVDGFLDGFGGLSEVCCEGKPNFIGLTVYDLAEK